MFILNNGFNRFFFPTTQNLTYQVRTEFISFLSNILSALKKLQFLWVSSKKDKKPINQHKNSGIKILIISCAKLFNYKNKFYRVFKITQPKNISAECSFLFAIFQNFNSNGQFIIFLNSPHPYRHNDSQQILLIQPTD